ncbi:exosortase [Verrucomicrobium sp. GAS474]|nr:exosortase [Verrucomicrobium sp. GAS474]
MAAFQVAIAFLGLYFFLPYLVGYSAQRDTVFRSIWSGAWVYDQGEWRYCFFVPVIVFWMVWSRREGWAGFVPVPARSAVWLSMLGASLGLYWIGYVVGVSYVGDLSFHLFIGAMILGFLGVEAFRRLLSPWLFLLFVYPMPFLDNMVAFPLRMVMTSVAHVVLSLMGLANVQVGTAILSAPKPFQGIGMGEVFSIDVADPCSGIRSLFALLMMAALYGYFTLPGGWRRGALVALAVPLALIGNVVRIVLLVFGVLIGGAPFAIGTLEQPSMFHEGVGLAVYGVALGGLVLSAGLLDRVGRRKKGGKPSDPAPTPAPDQGNPTA